MRATQRLEQGRTVTFRTSVMMTLAQLAPSLIARKDDDPIESRERKPMGRLTVLLGAGGSLFANAPSTQSLTAIVSARPISGAILRELQANADTANANFEDVLHVLEELDTLEQGTQAARAPSALRRFLEARTAIDGIAIDRSAVRQERFELTEAIGAAFDAIDYDSTWSVLYGLLRPFLDDFDLDVFTLNYDLLTDIALFALTQRTGLQWFDGFGGPLSYKTFEPNYYANWPPEWGTRLLTLAHLHGSLSFAIHEGDPRLAHGVPYELVECYDLQEVRRTWAWATHEARQHPDVDFAGVVPIVSGLRKLEKLNVQPYANYYAYFARAISSSPYLLIVGYGAGDEHINYWLREYTMIHTQKARAVEVTRSADPGRFAMQKFGAYDLRWSNWAKNDGVFVSAAGTRCLTITGGLTADTPFEGRLSTLMLNQYRGELRY